MKITFTTESIEEAMAIFALVSHTPPAEAEDEAPKRRKRRKSSDEDEAPKKTRRSRKAKDEDEEEAPKRNRRSSRKKKDEGISDSDMLKAASEAAAVITPATVTEILEEFGVSGVADIAQDQRQEFLDMLKSEIEAED